MKTKQLFLTCVLLCSTFMSFEAMAITVNFQKPSAWNEVYLYAWLEDEASGTSSDVLGIWPGLLLVDINKDGWYTYSFDENITGINFIFSNSQGVQSSDLYTTTDVCYSWDVENDIEILESECNVAPDHLSFESNGIYYQQIGAESVEVTYGSYAPYNYYNINGEYTGSFTIPATVEYNNKTYQVISISDNAFRNCSGLTSISIPNSITEIGSSAFADCSGLTSVTLSNNITTISSSLFSGCTNLAAITIPNSVTSIGYDVFRDCSNLTAITWNAKDYTAGAPFSSIASQITSFTFSEELTSIPASLCQNMSKLTTITIPESVTSIGFDAFRYCSSLSSITIPNSVTWVGDGAFLGTGLTEPVYNAHVFAYMPTSYSGAYTIPAGIHSIAPAAFAHCENLTSIVIPNDVKYLGNGAFQDCYQLQSVTLSDSLTEISYAVFANCGSLKSIIIPSQVKSIWGRAFYDCNLQKITCLAKEPPTIEYNSFDSYSTPLYVRGESIAAYQNALYWSNFTHIYAAYDIEQNGIYYLKLGGDSVAVAPSISEYRGDIVIPTQIAENSTIYRVTSICQKAFKDCKELTSITIPNSVTTIGQEAFYRCTGLTALTIPENVDSIGERAFVNLDNLTSVVWNAKNCRIPLDSDGWGYSVFGGVSYDEWGNIDYNYEWKSNITSFTFGSKIESIPAYICSGLSKLSSITIPESVKTIGRNAFYNCSGLTGDLVIPNSVTTIESYAFYKCSGLTSVTIGTGLEVLEGSAFAYCNGLTKFICKSTKAIEAEEDEDCKNDSYIGEYAQEGAFVLTNKQLDTIVAPAQLFDLSEPAWSNLTKKAKYIQIIGGELTPDAFGVINRSYKVLETLDMAAATNTDIADEAFKGCYKLETLLLPSQLERIGYMAVADCKNLQAIDIPATVTDIDDSAFENCRSIQTLTFGGQQPASAPAFEETHHRRVSTASTSALQRIGNWAFYNCHELQHLEIPEGVTEIGAAAFYGCTYLEDLTLPASVQSIGDNCFALCSKLNKITCLATVPPTIEAKTFYDVKRSIPLYVPEASINDYANDTYWGEFINTQAAETPDGVDNILQEGTSSTRKVLENGTIYILRNGERYTIDGRKVE